VKGLEKITSVRLAEILAEKSVVSSEVITDALYSQDKCGEPFAQLLIAGGHITEWDMAKLITEHFNLPFLLSGNYQIGDEAKNRFPKEVLFQHCIVPLDIFSDIVCIVMPVLLTFDEISKIQRDHSCELFPYVGLVSENKKVLAELFKDFPQWMEREAKRREETSKPRNQAPSKISDWMSIFDAGDQAIKEVQKAKPPLLGADQKLKKPRLM
jgi:hypothetical protein